MRTSGLSSCVLCSRLCWLSSSCESSIGIPIEFAILLWRARTKLDWEFATLYSVDVSVFRIDSFQSSHWLCYLQVLQPFGCCTNSWAKQFNVSISVRLKSGSCSGLCQRAIIAFDVRIYASVNVVAGRSRIVAQALVARWCLPHYADQN